MADFNAIGNPFLAGALGRLFGVERPQVPVISSEVQFTTSPWERPEFWALAGGALAFGQHDVPAAGAGQRSNLQVRNPTNSGIIAIVEECWFQANVSQGYQVFVCSDEFPLISTGWSARDTRLAQQGGIHLAPLGTKLRYGAWVGFTGALLYQYPAPAATQFVRLDNLSIVLSPGWGLGIRPTVDNAGFSAGFTVRERPAPTPELSLR